MIKFANLILSGIAYINDTEIRADISFEAKFSFDPLKAEAKILKRQLFWSYCG